MRYTRHLKQALNPDNLNSMKLPPLPSRLEFAQYSRSLATLRKSRTFMAKEEEANKISDYFGPNLWKDKVVAEMFPGPGTFTRSMLRGGAKGIIPLETAPTFRPALEELEKAAGVPFDHQHADFRADNFMHSLVYDVPEEHHKLTRPTHPWEEVHPNMILTGLSSSINESYHLSFLLQETLFNRIGWFKYGRVPLVLLMAPEVMKGFINASLIGFLWRAVADVDSYVDLDPSAFINKRTLQAIKVIPAVKPKIEAPLDIFRYVVHQLMIRKVQPVRSCLSGLAPGAPAFRNKLNFDTAKQPRHMTLEEMDQLAVAYLTWYKERHGVLPTHSVF